MIYAKTLTFVAAVLATGISFAAEPPEGSYPQVDQTSSAVSRASVAAEAARWNRAGQPGQVRGEDRPEFVRSSGSHSISRSQVIADRDAFARAGAIRIGNDG